MRPKSDVPSKIILTGGNILLLDSFLFSCSKGKYAIYWHYCQFCLVCEKNTIVQIRIDKDRSVFMLYC